MKNILIALLSLMLAVPGVLASANADMSDSELGEYFIFETGTWWDYVNYIDTASDYDTSEITFVDDIEDATTRAERLPCRISQCFSVGMGQIYIEYFIEDGKIYMDTYDGYDTNDFLVFSLDGLEDVQVDALWGYLLGYDSLSGYETSMQCSVDFGTYAYQGYEGDSIQHTCSTFLKGPDEVEHQVVSSEYYLRGVGKVLTETKLYQDGEWQITYSLVLNETSVDLEEVEGLTEEADGKEVIDTVVEEMNEEEEEEEEEEVVLAAEESSFSDVESDHDNYAAVEYLYEEGVIGGYEDGSFKPENTVNRAELLKILVEGQGITPDAELYKNCFPDVTTDWYAKYVCYAKSQAWISGYSNGYFLPADPVNKVEALKMLLNSQSIEITVGDQSSFDDFSENEWFAPYVAKAQALGILEETGSSFHADEDRTRGGISENLYRLLLSLQVDGVSSAMSETTCLQYDASFDLDEFEAETEDIMEAYGFEDIWAIDAFIDQIRGLDIFELLSAQLEMDLEEECGESVDDASALAEAMLEE
ncbi:MAG: S-layer homology domain-containing protein [Candidatus Gracilibacteria bacterium]|jgi:hypothetical protein